MHPSSHPNMVHLQRYLDHQPLPEEQTRHILSCAVCQENLAAMQQENKQLNELFASIPDAPDQTERIMGRIRRLPLSSHSPVIDFPRLALIPILLITLGITQLVYLIAIKPTWYDNLTLFFNHLVGWMNTLLFLNRAGPYFISAPSTSYLFIGITFLFVLLTINLVLKKRGYKHANKTI